MFKTQNISYNGTAFNTLLLDNTSSFLWNGNFTFRNRSAVRHTNVQEEICIEKYTTNKLTLHPRFERSLTSTSNSSKIQRRLSPTHSTVESDTARIRVENSTRGARDWQECYFSQVRILCALHCLFQFYSF
jgi:hypothetical protein